MTTLRVVPSKPVTQAEIENLHIDGAKILVALSPSV
jgi:hypothetical protein